MSEILKPEIRLFYPTETIQKRSNGGISNLISNLEDESALVGCVCEAKKENEL